MLTPQERAALARIEQRLLLEDPAFAARLRRARRPRVRRPRVRRQGARHSAPLLALSLISVSAGLAVLLVVKIALLLGQTAPVSVVVGLTVLCLGSGVACAVHWFVPDSDVP